MREDIPHPDKRTSWRVVIESSPVHSRGFSRSRKGIRFALPLHSQALRGMVWDWRSFHSLVPKVVSFGVSHKEEREGTKILTRRRELASDYVIKKNIRRRCHKRLTYLSPRDILYMLKDDEVFIRDLWGLLTTFRASEVCGFLWISPPKFSYVFPRRPPASFAKRNNVTEGWHPPPSVI